MTKRTFLDSKRLNSVNSHRDRVGRGREMQNRRCFCSRLLSSRLKSVNVTGIGAGLVVPSLAAASQKCAGTRASMPTGIRVRGSSEVTVLVSAPIISS